MRAGLLQTVVQPRGPDRLQHLDGWDVQGLRQRLPDGDGAVPILVEVLRHVEAETRRPVLYQCLGMRKARIEGQTVDQRLQRRAW